MKKLLLIFLIGFMSQVNFAQNNTNKLGAWIWVIEQTTCKTHAELADSLKKLNVKEIFVKVADGKSFSNWPELDDKALVKAYKDKGVKVWGWTYNYPGNEAAQAEAIYRAAKAGYEGLVIDVEVEFNNDSLSLYKLFAAFDARKKDAIKDGVAKTGFPLRVTTWGNPKTHKYNLKAMDKFVDAYMPQTYVEQWDNGNPAKGYVKNLETWIDKGNKEYKDLGATKPIYHILAAEREYGTTGAITIADVNKYFAKSGTNTTLWRIPGGAIKAKNWELWRGINWKKDFTTSTNEQDLSASIAATLYPNPFSNDIFINFENTDNEEITIEMMNIQGQIVKKVSLGVTENYRWELGDIPSGTYLCHLQIGKKTKTFKVIKS